MTDERKQRGAAETVTGKEPTLPADSPAPHPIDPVTGQHKDHWVLSAEERSSGYVRPVRKSYLHSKCGTITTMALAIAQTYAKNPGYYGYTFCVYCKAYLPVGEYGEFFWLDDGTKVGT